MDSAPPPAHARPPPNTARFPSARGRGGARGGRGGGQISHNPSPALTSITISDHSAAAPQQQPPPVRPEAALRPMLKVLIQNLPVSVNQAKLTSMSATCGQVKDILLQPEKRSAVIEFCDASGADSFFKQHNRKMMDLAILNVRKIC